MLPEKKGADFRRNITGTSRYSKGLFAMKNMRILTYVNEAREIRKGGLCAPRMVILYPAYSCNLHCAGCLYRLENAKKAYIAVDRLIDNLYILKGLGMQSIEFSGGGEPLTHPSIEKLISICSNRLNLSVGVITNGVLLTPSISHLIVSRAVYIRISIYPETFDIVKEKIRYLGTLKKRYSSGITLGTKLLLSRRNVNIVVEQCRQLAQMDEIDLISVKAERNSGDEVDNQTARQVSQTLNDIGDGRMSVALHKTYLTQKCWLTPIHTVIDPLGDVYMCCYYPHRKHQHRIGNIYEQNYDQFWWSEVHVEKIRRISITQCNLYDCRWHEYNNVLDRLLEDNELHYQFC